MSVIKQRHYNQVADLVRRDKGDAPLAQFFESLDHKALTRNLLAYTTAKPTRPEAPTLVSSADGDISRLLLTIPSYAVADDIMAAAYQELIRSLPEAVELVVLVQDAAHEDVEAWLKTARKIGTWTSQTFDDALNISIWAEDGYVVARDGAAGPTYLIEPYAFPRYGDGLVADFVSNFTDLRDTQAPLYFQGGNCLIGDTFFFIGADYPANSIQYISSSVLTPPSSKDPVEFIHDQYKSYLDVGRELYYVGSRLKVPAEAIRPITLDGESWTEIVCGGNKPGTTQPLFHIDMFVTLVGRGTEGYELLVGDPRLAYETLGFDKLPEHAMADVFDDIAASLSGLGFVVRRNPLPIVYMDDPEVRERQWYFATSNNALVQNGSTKEVWLPTYGYGVWRDLEKTDQANKDLWESLGFTVHQLPDFHPFAENLGAVHCIKKYLARK